MTTIKQQNEHAKQQIQKNLDYLKYLAKIKYHTPFLITTTAQRIEHYLNKIQPETHKTKWC